VNRLQTDLKGRVVFVSGAGRGLGRRTAERFGELGARLVVSDYSREMIMPTAEALAQSGVEVTPHFGDVALEETAAGAARLIGERYGVLDIAVNNAGIAQPHSRLHEMDSALAEKVIAVDLLGVFFAMKHQIPLMLAQVENSGRQCVLLNVASAAGLMGSPMLAAYSAAKHGVVGLTRTAAVEYGRKGLRINCICPAFTKTDMVLKPLEESPHGRQKAEANMVAINPMQRLGEIDEVVQAMVWACQPENSFFNGQALAVDGGLSA
jgi:NAD(P)-dependent dehydrogenase (short-subunit alcohol dehydrogenase family)